MANEIYLQSATGLTVSCQLYSGTSTVGAPFAATELGTTGTYVASMPSSIPFGQYAVVATASGNTIASGVIYWSSQYELNVGQAKINGFDASNPSVNTPTSRVSGDLELDVSGYGTALTTITNAT